MSSPEPCYIDKQRGKIITYYFIISNWKPFYHIVKPIICCRQNLIATKQKKQIQPKNKAKPAHLGRPEKGI